MLLMARTTAEVPFTFSVTIPMYLTVLSTIPRLNWVEMYSLKETMLPLTMQHQIKHMHTVPEDLSLYRVMMQPFQTHTSHQVKRPFPEVPYIFMVLMQKLSIPHLTVIRQMVPL